MMEQELWQQFRTRFIESTTTRLQRARAIIAGGDPANDALASELHALAGEASILGVEGMAKIARDAERTAKYWGASSSDTTLAQACKTAIDNLDAALKDLDRS